MTEDRRWFSSLTLVMTKEYITFGDNGKGRVLSVGMVKVTTRLARRPLRTRRMMLEKMMVMMVKLQPSMYPQLPLRQLQCRIAHPLHQL
jgi:hypothetical protein